MTSIWSEVYGDNIGASVSGAGDVNGDGFDDVIVGASGADRNGDNSGSSYVVFGKASGFSATLNLTSIDGSVRWLSAWMGRHFQMARAILSAMPVMLTAMVLMM
ncbi:integrin alpha [Nitrosomonas sp.]|uniref:integrin alpha n=1 Tax=Nitrosomonas sp. TaxID=42353 RepID=UPI0026379811|nr:integrin alpha [Nitrosomonas sp.]